MYWSWCNSVHVRLAHPSLNAQLSQDCQTELFGKDADKILRAKEEELNQERLQAGRRRAHHIQNGTGGQIRRRHASISGDASIIQNLRKNRRR